MASSKWNVDSSDPAGGRRLTPHVSTDSLCSEGTLVLEEDHDDDLDDRDDHAAAHTAAADSDAKPANGEDGLDASNRASTLRMEDDRIRGMGSDGAGVAMNSMDRRKSIPLSANILLIGDAPSVALGSKAQHHEPWKTSAAVNQQPIATTITTTSFITRRPPVVVLASGGGGDDGGGGAGAGAGDVGGSGGGGGDSPARADAAAAWEGTGSSPGSTPRHRRRRRRRRLVCCSRGNDHAVARSIFNVLDMEGDNKVSWTEFCLFVKHSYEHFPALVQSFGDRGHRNNNHNNGTSDGSHSSSDAESDDGEADGNHNGSNNHNRDELSRFRRLILQAVMGDAIEKEELLVWEQLQDDVLEVLFEGSRKFEGKGFVAKTRRVFRRFDANDSGAISFTEFEDALHDLAFFDFNIEVHGKKLLLEERSIFCCPLRHPFRKGAIVAAYSPAFDIVLVVVIMLNTVVIAMEDHSDPNLGGDAALYTPLNQFVHYSDFFFTACYLGEFVTKVIASGFCIGRGVYLSSWWNVFDFAILCLSILTPLSFLFGDAVGVGEQGLSEIVKVLRVFRILRPLKTITAVPTMRQLASTLVAALRALKEVLLLLLLLWLIFASILVDLLHNSLNGRCRESTEEEMLAAMQLADDQRNALARLQNGTALATGAKVPVDISSAWTTTDLWRACGVQETAAHQCFRPSVGSGNVTNATLAPDLCLSVDDLQWVTPVLPPNAVDTFIWKNDTFAYNEGMNFGITQFDNLGFALISLFQISTLEGWVNIMYLVQDGYYDLLAFWLFFLVQLICGVLMIGLVLAVISSVYTVESERQLDIKATSTWTTPTVTIFGIKGFSAVVNSMKSGSLHRWIQHIRRKLADRTARRKLVRGATTMAHEPTALEVAARQAALDRANRDRARQVKATDDDNDDDDDDDGVDHDGVGTMTAAAATTLSLKPLTIEPGDGLPEHVRRAKEKKLRLSGVKSVTRSPAVYRRCLKAVNVTLSPPLSRVIAFFVILNVVFMCTAVFVDAEYESCQDKVLGVNDTAACQSVDRDAIICVSNLFFVAVLALETASRWTAMLVALCMSGTCTGTHWRQSRDPTTPRPVGKRAAVVPVVTTKTKKTPLPGGVGTSSSSSAAAAAVVVAKPSTGTPARSSSSASLEFSPNDHPGTTSEDIRRKSLRDERLNSSCCTGRCRVDERCVALRRVASRRGV